ncbi:MAG: carboxylating nicotinate-nucleotide diphosphorylase [Chromatiaceae bacterium]|jgi:nicotinate-nucleotide pyrophosphorylase (carboxylating)|nr:carboxylating nicotinate-nucleotide diphosphorylase [Chromatiaceae bacterium]
MIETGTQIDFRKELEESLPPNTLIERQVRAALAEDLGDGDRTAALLPVGRESRVELISRQHLVVCGGPWFDDVFRQLDSRVRIEWQVAEGERAEQDQILCRLAGSTRALLTGERTALNYLQTLSGTASRARQYADAVAGLQVRLLDTRKTIPGLRLQQKYAVRCGGCYNHRIGLFDAILIKENHILAAGSIAAALEAAFALADGMQVEIEVESLGELSQALDAGATHLLLDNFDLDQLRRAVALVAGKARLEASGGVTLDSVRDIAETGVDDISVGNLTKDVESIDLSMRFVDV